MKATPAMPSPRITFLMPVYNNADTITAATESILTQTFSDFELLIIDDGCTDATRDRLAQLHDDRIRIAANPKNIGLSASLNVGLKLARGAYIARMDADDLSLHTRAATQIAFLDSHPNISVVGSFIETFSTTGSAPPHIVTYPTDAPSVAATLLFRSALAHPAVMIRKSSLDTHATQYDTQFRCAQDYALWMMFLAHRLQLANIPEVLLRYRVHAGQLSHQFDAMQDEGTLIRSKLLRHLCPDIRLDEEATHDALSRNHLVPHEEFINSAVQWLAKLVTLNRRHAFFDHQALLQTLTGRYVTLIRFAAAHDLPVPDPATSPFAEFIHPDAWPK